MSFKVGDIVRLISDGPRMVVREIDESWYRCIWFDTKGDIHRDSFPEFLLKKDEAKEITQSRERAHEEGYLAARKSTGIHNNPYQAPHQAHLAQEWADGYHSYNRMAYP